MVAYCAYGVLLELSKRSQHPHLLSCRGPTLVRRPLPPVLPHLNDPPQPLEGHAVAVEAVVAHFVTPLARSRIFASAFASNSANCSGDGAVLESKHPASLKRYK